MKKYLDIKGRNVVDCQGTLLGSVEDCIFDSRTNKICSLIVSSSRLFSSSSILPLSCVLKLGDTIIYNGGAFSCKRKRLFMKRIITLNEILGKQIINLEGINEGHVADLIIDDYDWEIVGLVCSRGLVEDMLGGRRLVLMSRNIILINDKILVQRGSIKPFNCASVNHYIERGKLR